jgi:hypothetical protein
MKTSHAISQAASDQGRISSDDTAVGSAADSLGIGAEEQELDLLGAGGIGKKRRGGTIILIGVVVLAIGSLFSMRTLTKGYAASARGSDAENTVERFLRSLGGGPDGGPSGADVLRVLAPVEPEERPTPRDPFEQQETILLPVVSTTDGPEIWRAQVERAAETFNVTSVIKDRMAIINKRIVPLGAAIVEGGVTFTITDIGTDYVTVTAEDPANDLKYEGIVKVRRRF